jgi:hypothetical protein
VRVKRHDPGMQPAWDAIAKRALEQLAPDERDTSVVYLDERILPAGATVEIDGRAVPVRGPSVLAFVDLEPRLNWGHRSRYLLVDAESGDVESFDARMPPFLRGVPATLRVVWQGADVPDETLVV